MSERCPKCGRDTDDGKSFRCTRMFMCGSTEVACEGGWRFGYQSDRCLIVEQEAELVKLRSGVAFYKRALGLVQRIAFETDRLSVHLLNTGDEAEGTRRDLFIAKDRCPHDWPGVYGTCSVDPEPGCLAVKSGPCIDWLEISIAWRRNGFATELVKGIELYYGREIEWTPVTPEGEAWSDAMEARAK